MKPDFDKGNGLIPAIIQDSKTANVLMLGYMNAEAFAKTQSDKKVCFFSRSKNRLWVKGETSGNFLFVKDIRLDCDNDCLLIQAEPVGPVCHTGSITCFTNENPDRGILHGLQKTIADKIDADDPDSYSNKMYKKGINKMAQKVGEEAVELVIEAMGTNDSLFVNEAADLMYHLLLLCKGKNIPFSDVEKELERRKK